jgi:hypothetical protein
MTRTLARRELLTGGAAALLAGLAGCSGMTPFVGKRLEYSRTIDPDGVDSLAVAVDAGDVTLRADERRDVAVKYVKKSSSVQADLSKLHFRTTRSDGTLRLRSEWNGGNSPFGGRPQVDVDAAVPTALSVDRVETKAGDVSISDVDGDVTLRSAAGDVVAKRVTGTVDAETQAGDVRIEDPDAIGDLRTATGDVRADVPAIDGATKVTTETGDVTVYVSSAVDADLVARTETGEVNVDGLSLSNVERTDDFVGSTVRGGLGDGGPRLLLETQTGDVTVRTLD